MSFKSSDTEDLQKNVEIVGFGLGKFLLMPVVFNGVLKGDFGENFRFLRKLVVTRCNDAKKSDFEIRFFLYLLAFSRCERLNTIFKEIMNFFKGEGRRGEREVMYFFFRL